MNFKIKFLSLVFVVMFFSSAFCKNIAVIPFTNITKDESKDWIGAGFSETLTTKLGKVKSINLIEREQLSKIIKELKFQYSGFVDEKTAVEVGKIYGIDIMVLGSFQIINNSLRASARFVDVASGKIIDTTETTGSVNDIFKLQDDIAFSLLNSLNIVLAEKEKEEIKINPTKNLDAYQWFVKGYNAYNSREYDIAIDYFTNAIKIDIEYAIAYCGRGYVYFLHKNNYNKAISDYNKAIELIPSGECGSTWQKGTAYILRGIAYDDKGNYDSAIADYNKAIQLNPQNALAYYNRGNAYAKKGDHKKAIKDFNKVVENINSTYCYSDSNSGYKIYYCKSDNNKELSYYNKAIQLNPKLADAYFKRGTIYYFKGNYKKAISDLNKTINLNLLQKTESQTKEFHLTQKNSKALAIRGIIYQILGNCKKANADYKIECASGGYACSFKCY